MTDRNATNKVLVIGVSGLVGRAAAERFAGDGWDVIGISRRRPRWVRGVETHSVDLLDEQACQAFADAHAGDVTHVVYAALQERPGLFEGWIDDELIERNATMARNIFEPVLATAERLRHVSLMHGTKAYGVHHPDLGLDGIHMPCASGCRCASTATSISSNRTIWPADKPRRATGR